MISSDWQGQIFLKRISEPNLGQKGLNQAENEFGSYVFLEIA